MSSSWETCSALEVSPQGEVERSPRRSLALWTMPSSQFSPCHSSSRKPSALLPFLLWLQALLDSSCCRDGLISSLTTVLSSVQFSCSVVSDSLWPHELQRTRPPCPSSTPGAYSNSCPLSQWCHPAVSSSIILFSSHLQSFPASGSFPMSQFFPSGGQRIGASASASVLPMNIQDWFPFELTGLISVQSKGLSRVFSNTTVQKHQIFDAQFSS